MSNDKPILVLGTGELGIEVLRALAGHSQRASRSVTVLLRPCPPDHESVVRRGQQVGELTTLGISRVEADIVHDSQSVLERIFEQYHTIIGCTGMTYPSGTQYKIAQAVLASKARRYLPWQFGVDYDIIGRSSSQELFSEQLDVRDLLRAQSVTSWVIISTGLFMSFLFEPVFGVVDADRTVVTALGGWDNEVTVTTPQDIGKVVAEVVCAEPELSGVIYTAGATSSYATIADTVTKVQRGKELTVRRELATVNHLKSELASDPDNGLKKYRVVFAEGKGVAWDEADTFNRKRGMSLCGIEKWLTDQG